MAAQQTSPVADIQSAFLKGAERLTRFPVDVFKAYTGIGLKQMRHGMNVHQSRDLVSAFAEQQEVLQGLASRVREDGRRLIRLRQEIGQSVRRALDDATRPGADTVGDAGGKATATSGGGKAAGSARGRASSAKSSSA